MHNIEITEVSEDFARCWNAAGLRIQNQAQGPLQSWLRAHLNPPFLVASCALKSEDSAKSSCI